MSRIGKMPIAIPAGVTVDIAENNVVTVKGPKGELTRKLAPEMTIEIENNEIKVSSIAVQSGFSSPQRFNVAFRKLMGKTPMEYRKEHMK